MSIDTDAKQQKAASPHLALRRSSLRYPSRERGPYQVQMAV